MKYRLMETNVLLGFPLREMEAGPQIWLSHN